MELKYRGGNCIQIDVKKDTVIVDGQLSGLGLKDVIVKNAVYLATQLDLNPAVPDTVQIDGPGEYEVRSISVKGIAAQRMIDEKGVKKSTIYRVVVEGIAIAIVGHITFELTDEEQEQIGLVDIVVIPVGGGGYTLDAQQAVKITKLLDPKVVIPTHYHDEDISYEVPQNHVEEFVKEMGGAHEKVASYKLKTAAALPATLTVVEITRS